MSIFSRLLKRGPEDGGTPPPETAEQPAAAKPAPPARDAAPPPAAPPAQSASKSPAEPKEAKEPRAAKEPGEARDARETKEARHAKDGKDPKDAKEGKEGKDAKEAKPASPSGKAPVGVTKTYHSVTKPAPATGPAAPGMVPARPPARSAPAARPAPSPTAARAAVVAPAVPAPAPYVESAEIEVLSGAHAAEDQEQPAEQTLPSTTGGSRATAGEGGLAASDRRAVMATFEELAVGHTAQVRSFMLEVRWGEAQTSWIELARPALKSLRAMAGQMEHATLISALDGFDAALDEMLRPGSPPVVGPAARDRLLDAYGPLVAVMPRAFELDGERDRREPLVVRALLQQVAGLDPLMIDKMMAAGLGRLDALFRAKADEIAAVAGLAADVAAATAARVQAFRRATPAPLATPDMGASARELGVLYQTLESDHRAFEDASRGWSEGDRDAKKRLRRQRELGFLQVTIALARLGEVDLALRLEKVPFARRLEELERLVDRLGPLARASAAAEGRGADGEIRKIDMDVQSGAHAAP